VNEELDLEGFEETEKADRRRWRRRPFGLQERPKLVGRWFRVKLYCFNFSVDVVLPMPRMPRGLELVAAVSR